MPQQDLMSIYEMCRFIKARAWIHEHTGKVYLFFREDYLNALNTLHSQWEK